jgi:hypothetical protein
MLARRAPVVAGNAWLAIAATTALRVAKTAKGINVAAKPHVLGM